MNENGRCKSLIFDVRTASRSDIYKGCREEEQKGGHSV